MDRILYSAKTSAGKAISGFVQADSNDAALQILQNKAYTDIQFHLSNEFVKGDAFERVGKMDPQEISNLSQHIIRNQTRSRLAKKWIGVLKLLEIPLSLGILLLFLGFIFDSQILKFAAIVSAVLLLVILYFTWFKIIKAKEQFSKVSELIAYGKYLYAEKLIDKLLETAPSKIRKVFVTELITKKACVIAQQQTLAQGLAYFESMKDELSAMPEWQSDYNLARIHSAADDCMNYLKILREAHKKAPDKQILSLDLAASEARCGELDNTKQLLGAINMTTLPQLALPYVDMVKGLIAKKSHDPSTLEHFNKAYQGQMKFKNNAAALQLLGLMAGLYGLALLDAGNTGLAERVVREHWDVLKHLSYRDLLQELKDRLPILNNI